MTKIYKTHKKLILFIIYVNKIFCQNSTFKSYKTVFIYIIIQIKLIYSNINYKILYICCYILLKVKVIQLSTISNCYILITSLYIYTANILE